jgi:putative cardiolipin synthase
MRSKTVPLLIIAALFAGGCATLPEPPLTTGVYSLPPAASGTLAEVSAQFRQSNPAGQSGFLLLEHNDEAMNWRLALIDHATVAIDAQYFIWQADAAGRLLFDRLLKAADRGVRVRVLVDDLVFAAKDRNIAAICRHPNFEIKIFNPGKVRDSTLGGIGEFLLYFRELNRRMHNKLFVVDNRMAIVGGRNIGNEYFGLGQKYNFRDLEVLVTGPVVEELSRAFDVYWNTKLAYPGSAMSSEVTIEDLQILREAFEETRRNDRDRLSSYPVEPKQWERVLNKLPSLMHAGTAHFIQDIPVIFSGEQYRLVDMLDRLAAPSDEELLVVTPYLIPVGTFLEDLARLTSEEVKVRLLTGSMGANNHTAAHSHYKKYRRRILAAGAQLYEFKHDPSPEIRDISDVEPIRANFIALHIKALVADRKRCFIGSLNLDPRAVEINTENGLYIESAGLCGEMAGQFDGLMAPENAWRVTVDEDNRLRWESSSGMVTTQPARSFGQRIADFFFRLLPIESQL